VATFLAALLAEITAPGMNGRLVTRVSWQRAGLGHPLDDLVVSGWGADAVPFTLSLQIKRALVVSDAKTNKDFRETVIRAHETLSTSGFLKDVDRVGFVVGTIADGSFREFGTLCEWARHAHDGDELATKLAVPGLAGRGKQQQFQAVRSILADRVAAIDLDAATHALLAHFVALKRDMVGESSTADAEAMSWLAEALADAARQQAGDLWRSLLNVTRLGGASAASLERKTLVARLAGRYRLKAAASLAADLQRLTSEARLAAAEIAADIGGYTVSRLKHVERARDTLATARFVQIGGSPGAGKSAVLKALVDEAVQAGPVLFVKTDRLSGSTWNQYATAMGIASGDLEGLLIEIGAVGTSTLFIDGLDRVDREARGVITDLLEVLLNSEALQAWRVIATVRDTGIEPVRVWIPRGWVATGAPVIEVSQFDDDEATTLAEHIPTLAPLLWGDEPVKSIARRPFFAAVLARQPASRQAPLTEIELAKAWWERGGYAAEAASALRRQQALVAMAKDGAVTLGRRVPILNVNPEALADLEADGVVRQIRRGLTASFSHDIYFEWAFLQLLVSWEEGWLEAVREVGEPPALGRVVELLSQAEISEGDAWAARLAALEVTSSIRSQWLRAWMLGPIGLPTLATHESIFNAAMLEDGARRVNRLTVWAQAEKTRPNGAILSTSSNPSLEIPERLRIAESLAWPSDLQAWRRLCDWLIRHVDTFDRRWLPNVLTVFEVWQNAASNVANALSKRILSLCSKWVQDIEVRADACEWPRDYGGWELIPSDEREHFEARLRAMILRSGRACPALAKDYLAHLRRLERLPRNAFKNVMDYSPILSEVCADDLASFCLAVMLEPLPVDQMRNRRERDFGSGIHSQDWQDLSINDEHAYFPSAPTREPFRSLFLNAPDAARNLVRELANHAVKAFRQLHRLDYRDRGTPIPLTLEFPWGRQIFWGGGQQYLWSRGTWGSSVVASGLMALERWAFECAEAGGDVDQVLRDVVEGHTTNAVLSIVCAISLERKHCSDASFPVMTSQRVWHWDVKRSVNEMGMSPNLIGFEDRDHHFEAVIAGNSRACRRDDVRSLASLAVIRRGDFGRRVGSAIVAFADQLPVDLAEERRDEGVVASLRRTAEIWSQVGVLEAYSAEPQPDGKSFLIRHENPKAKGADIEAANQRVQDMNGNAALVMWADESFRQQSISARMTVRNAYHLAQKLDENHLFDEAASHLDPKHQRQAAVAAVAAVLLTFGGQLEDEMVDWASAVCLATWGLGEVFDGFAIPQSKLAMHPMPYAIKGFVGMLRRQPEDSDAVQALVTLSAHFYDDIKGAAVGGLLSLWDLMPETAWQVLYLACELALVPRHNFDEPAKQREQERVIGCIERALACLEAGSPPASLPRMPAAWVPEGEGRPARLGRRRRGVKVAWQHGLVDLDWNVMSNALAHLPVATVMQDSARREPFLAWCQDLVKWTHDRLAPPWASELGPRAVDIPGSELYEWRRNLYRFLARVSAHLEAEDAYTRFVAPAAATSDEVFSSLVEPMVVSLTCRFMDEPTPDLRLLDLMRLIVPRIQQHDGWRSYRQDAGPLTDRDLARMVRSLFFVEIEVALKAARFANGDWRDIALLFPVIEPLLQAHGTNRTLAYAHLTMCERAFKDLPLEAFVRQIPWVIGNRDEIPAGWRESTIPARLADLVQRFSERVQPLPNDSAQVLLRALDSLVDMGDRRAAAVQSSEAFKNVRVT